MAQTIGTLAANLLYNSFEAIEVYKQKTAALFKEKATAFLCFGSLLNTAKGVGQREREISKPVYMYCEKPGNTSLGLPHTFYFLSREYPP